MPLTKLFQSRKSQKNKKGEGLKKVDSGVSLENEPLSSTDSLDVEVTSAIKDIINNTVSKKLSKMMIVPPTPRNSTCVELEKASCSRPESDQNENSASESEPKQANSPRPKQKRSVSESDFKVNFDTKQIERRKFGSVGEVLSGDQLNVLSNERKGLDEMIGQYMEKIIRKSIMEAVKNVDVDSIYKEIAKDFSSRTNSESTDSVGDSVVEQRLNSDSFLQHAELQWEDESTSTADLPSEQPKGQLNEIDIAHNKDTDDAVISGYLADVDDFKSLGEDSSICSLSDGMKFALDSKSISDVAEEHNSSDKNKQACNMDETTNYSTSPADDYLEQRWSATDDKIKEDVLTTLDDTVANMVRRMSLDLKPNIKNERKKTRSASEHGESNISHNFIVGSSNMQENIFSKSSANKEMEISESSLIIHSSELSVENFEHSVTASVEETEHKPELKVEIAKHESKSVTDDTYEYERNPRSTCNVIIQEEFEIHENKIEPNENLTIERPNQTGENKEPKIVAKENVSDQKCDEFEKQQPSEENKNDEKQNLLETGTVPCKQNVESEEKGENLEEELRTVETTNNQVQSLLIQNVERQEEDVKVLVAETVKELKTSFPLSSSADDLISMSEGDELNECPNPNPPPDIDENLNQQQSLEESMKVNWKVGYLHVKLPPKSRGKTHLKAWKKRCVAIQPDEFVNDPKNPSLVISVYGAESRKHKATFWQTVSGQKAVIYRSSSRSHRYSFTISEEGRAIIHLSAESESATQEWMAAIRAVLWPPSPFMQLEKMLSGREFEISLVDNEFSYHAGLLGMYGYLTITPRKIILLHPQEGYVIQEWYLNTVDKFQLVPQPKTEDAHKVLAMTTCSDSSTGKGELLIFCNEAVTLLQSLASTIHQVLSSRSKQEGGRYQKELQEMAEWMVSPTQDILDAKSEEHYKVPPRQVKSLLDIPNFIFEKSLSPVSSAVYPAPPCPDILQPMQPNKTTSSQDSGISTCHSGEDFLNCSTTSFVIGGGPMTGKSSDSELSDAYTPPRTPELRQKMQKKLGQKHLSVPDS